MAVLAEPSPTGSVLGGSAAVAAASTLRGSGTGRGFSTSGTGAWRAPNVGAEVSLGTGAGAGCVSVWPGRCGKDGSGPSALATPAAVIAIANATIARFI